LEFIRNSSIVHVHFHNQSVIIFCFCSFSVIYFFWHFINKICSRHFRNLFSIGLIIRIFSDLYLVQLCTSAKPFFPCIPTRNYLMDYLFFRSTGDSSYFYLYRISYMWYSLLGFLLTFVLGLFISNLSRLFIKNQDNELDTNLFFPIIARRIHYRRRNNIQNERKFSLDKNFSQWRNPQKRQRR